MTSNNIHSLFLAVTILLLISCKSDNYHATIIQLAEELANHSQFTEIDDCTKSKKKLNGQRIYLDPANAKSGEVDIEDVLAQANINRSDYQYYVNKLQELNLRYYHSAPPYAVFIQGGALGEIHGYLVTPTDDLSTDILENGFRLTPYYYIHPTKKIADRLYLFQGR